MIDEKKLIEDMLNNDGIDFRMDFNTDTEDSALESLREFTDKFRQGMIELVQKQPKIGEWIPCSERLPIICGVYNVTRKISEGKHISYISDAVYFDGQNTWHSDNRVNHGREYLKDVIAWQPLPEPYKE